MVENNDNVVGDYSNGNKFFCEDTEDKIFLLSKGEVKNTDYGFTYVKNETSNESRQKTATDYAIANGVYVNANNGAWWWLRTPYYDYNNPNKDYSAHVIKVNGIINMNSVTTATGGIVPAMWIVL